MGSSSSVSKNKDSNISVIQSVSSIDFSTQQSHNFVKFSSVPVTESKVDDQKAPSLIGSTTSTFYTSTPSTEREKTKSESNQDKNSTNSSSNTFNGHLNLIIPAGSHTTTTPTSSKNTFEVVPTSKSVSVIEVEVVGDTTTTKIGQGGTKSDRDRPNSSENEKTDGDEIDKVLAEIEANLDFKSESNKLRKSVDAHTSSSNSSSFNTGAGAKLVFSSKNDTLVNVTNSNISMGDSSSSSSTDRHLSTTSNLQSDLRNMNNEGYVNILNDYNPNTSNANSFQNQYRSERSHNFQSNPNSKTPPDRGLKSQGGGHQHANLIIPPNRVRSEQSCSNRNIGLHTSYPIKSRPKPSQVLFFQQQLHQQQEDQRKPKIPGGGPLYSYSNSKLIKKKNESDDLSHGNWKYEPPKIDGFDINKFKEVNQKQNIKLDRSMPNLSVYNNIDRIEENKEKHSRSVNASPLPSYTEDELDLLLSIDLSIEKEIGN